MENYVSMDTLLRPLIPPAPANGPPPPEKWSTMVASCDIAISSLFSMVSVTIPHLTKTEDSPYEGSFFVYIIIYVCGFLAYALAFVGSRSCSSTRVRLTATMNMVSIGIGFSTVFFGLSYYSVKQAIIAECVTVLCMAVVFKHIFPPPPPPNVPPPPEQQAAATEERWVMNEKWGSMASSTTPVIFALLLLISGLLPQLMTLIKDSMFKDHFDLFTNVYAWGILAFALAFIGSRSCPSVILTASLDMASIIIGFSTIFWALSYFAFWTSIAGGCVTLAFMSFLFKQLFPERLLG